MKSKSKVKKDLPVKMVTPIFRLSFPSVFKARAFGDKPPEFSIVMLFDKTKKMVGSTVGTKESPGQPMTIKQLIDNAIIMKYGSLENAPEDLELPGKDGDNDKVNKKGDRMGYAGNIVMKATTKDQPAVVDKDMVAITDESEIYPGCYCKAAVYAYVWEHDETNRCGVKIILNHLQKIKDGKAFGGKPPVDAVFSTIDDSEMEDYFGEEAEESEDEEEISF